MNKLGLLLIFLLIFPTVAPAKSWVWQDTPANDCPGLSRACTGAARELIAAKNYIVGLERNITAADERINAAKAELAKLTEIDAIQASRAKELEAVIAFERQTKELLFKKIELQNDRIVKLEKSLARSRKFTLILGVAAGVGILIAVSK